MKTQLLQDKFPVFTLKFGKNESRFESAQAILEHLKAQVDAHPVTRLIAEFDHYSHTLGLQQGEMADDIVDARNLLFCFGIQLPKAEVLALRPRSIGIAEHPDGFTVSFMQAPNAVANDTMVSWVKALLKVQEAA